MYASNLVANYGSPTPYTHLPPRQGDEWYCAMCDLHIVAQLDQEIESAKTSQTTLPSP